MNSASLARASRDWKNWIGKTGMVLFCTSRKLAGITRPLALVKLDETQETRLFPVALGYDLQPHTRVQITLRRSIPRSKDHTNEVIEYLLAVKPIAEIELPNKSKKIDK